MPSKELSVGLIGLDTSHAVAFSKMLNEPGNSSAIPGAKVTCGFPGGSPDFPLSINRVEGITGTLRDELGVRIVDSPAAVADASAGHPYYEELLRVILASLPAGKEPIPHGEMLQVVRMIEAANTSRAENRPVSL